MRLKIHPGAFKSPRERDRGRELTFPNVLIATEVKHAPRLESTSPRRCFHVRGSFRSYFSSAVFPGDRRPAENSRGINRSVKAPAPSSTYYDQRFHAGIFVSRYLANSEVIRAAARARKRFANIRRAPSGLPPTF